MNSYRYHELNPVSKDKAEEIFSSGDAASKVETLLALSNFEKDRKWVEEKCINYLQSDDVEIKRAAITSLGHLARVHGELDLGRVMPIFEEIKKDSRFSEIVEDALDDIEIFVLK